MLALPYDVFDRGEAAEYVEDRPLSFLNIDRPETQFPADQDMYAPEVYARGAELLHERLKDGTFVEDRNLAYYIYRLAWEGHVQTGIVCVCAVDEFESGIIKRHELTREDKERDRIEHIEALGCQTGPIFLTYRDQPVLDMIVGAATTSTPLYDFADESGVRQTVWEVVRHDAVDALRAMLDQPVLDMIVGAATTSTPLYDFADESGVRQTVWEVVRHDAVDALRAMLGTIPCAYIADGHHRAASAVKVARRMREEARAAGTYTGKEPFNYVLSVLFPANQLTILPYNRVVSDRNGLDAYELLEVLSGAGFGIVQAEGPVEPREHGVFGMYTDGTWYELRADDPNPRVYAAENASSGINAEMGSAEDGEHRNGGSSQDDGGLYNPANSLDCPILQSCILSPIFGIKDPRTDPRVSFVGGIRGTEELERKVGAEGVAFTMCATSIDQLLAVADAGEVMPPKSTWFEPKLRSGLFIHRIAK